MRNKTCTKCKAVKPIGDFYEDGGHEDGLGSWCKVCKLKGCKQHRVSANHKPITGQVVCSSCGERKFTSEFYKDRSKRNGLTSYCRACQKKAINRRRKKDPVKTRVAERRKMLKTNFGITLEQYDQMFEKQNGVCAICNGINADGRRLAVDHSHETGKVRGLLCTRCNIGLGTYENRKEEFKKYLRSYKI